MKVFGTLQLFKRHERFVLKVDMTNSIDMIVWFGISNPSQYLKLDPNDRENKIRNLNRTDSSEQNQFSHIGSSTCFDRLSSQVLIE